MVTDYIIDDMSATGYTFSPICTYCKHISDITIRKCRAFDSIPDEIWTGKNKHNKPHGGDSGITFKSRDINAKT